EEKEGGYGWFVILGAFLCQVTAMGVGSSVMQAYLVKNDFNSIPNVLLVLPFVGTLGMVFLNLMGPIAQIITSRFGPRATLILGTLCKGLGLIIAGWGSQPWHLIICQGMLFGTGASLTYVTAMAVAPQWFHKKRSIAISMVAAGSGVGGVVFPLIMNAALTNLGAAWAYRILGFICLALDSLACILIREKIVIKPRIKKSLGDIIHLNVLKDINYCIFCIGSVIGLLGYFVPYFFLPSYANYVGLDSSQGANLITVASACNFFGRLLAGLFAQKIGMINTNIIFTVIGGLSSLLIWTFATNYGTLMAYAAVFGLFCGSYFALLSPITAFLVGMERYPTALSLLLITNIISVFGPNMASAIDASATGARPYISFIMFAGVTYIVGALFLIVLKFRLNRNPLVKI
ncbi:major facilitator superfamily domain-containing protein, partial [Cunninghamella echinulata]